MLVQIKYPCHCELLLIQSFSLQHTIHAASIIRSSQYTINVLARLKFHLSADNFFTHVVEIGKTAFI